MTWVCVSNTHMQEADETTDNCPEAMFLTQYMENTAGDWDRDRFYSTASIDMDRHGRITDTARPAHNDVWCAPCGDAADNLTEDALIRRYVQIATEQGWVLCSHGDAMHPVLLNCEDCWEQHANAAAHIGLPASMITSVDEWDQLRIDPEPPRPRARPTFTDNQGRTFDWDLPAGRYIQRRPPPRTLHDLIGNDHA